METTDKIRNRRVLIIDDNVATQEAFRSILAVGNVRVMSGGGSELPVTDEAAPRIIPSTFDLDYALQGNDGAVLVSAALASGRPYAVAFVDMHMPPGWDGAETIERLWAIDPDLQMVICCAYSEYDWMQIIARLGNADKLLTITMPFEPIEVLQCARALSRKWLNEHSTRQQMQALAQVASSRKEGWESANKQIQHLATHDALTGLPNRLLMEDRLARALIHSERNSTSFAVLMIDIDKLQLVNDALGHDAGDALLREVGRRLSSLIRDVDTLVRVAGDEFLLILNPIAVAGEARSFATCILQALKPTLQIADVEVHTTASIGIAFFPGDGTTSTSLISHANAAMYYAKERGRNNFQCFAPGMDTATRDSAQLQSDLHSALALQQFELHYQPKIDVATGIVHGAEALIRWRHPERGLISPLQFIPFAEDGGLIGAIGEWVVREACRQAKSWQRDGLPALRIAVNLSASQFRHGRLLETVKEALADAQLDPKYLEVELTESAVMSDPEGSVKILEQLSTMGVLVSVDDFGTGYSSMSYLQRFPIDKLKIDRSFISAIETRSDDASIVRAIVSLAHSLKLKVVAEGVETSEQLEFLKSIGCDQYQGYYFSKALPGPEFEALIRSLQGDSGQTFAESDLDRTQSKLWRYDP